MQKGKEKSEEKYCILQLLISFKHETSIYYNKVGPCPALSGGWMGESLENEEVFCCTGEVLNAVLTETGHGRKGSRGICCQRN